MSRRPPRLCDLRAAWWAHCCLRSAKERLAAGHLDVWVRPPTLPATAIRGVEATLRRSQPTCLEAALVRQRWLEAQGVRRDVVIGVTAPSAGFKAHAWLDDPGEFATGQRWQELTRLTA